MDRNLCKLHGGPFDECPDDEAEWFVVRDYCVPAARLAAAQRQYDHLHQDAPWHDGSWARWAKEWSAEFCFHYQDATIRLSPVDENPADEFLTDQNASPLGAGEGVRESTKDPGAGGNQPGA